MIAVLNGVKWNTEAFEDYVNPTALVTDFSVYPNPVSDEFTIELSEKMQVNSIQVYNVLQQEVMTLDVNNELTQQQVDLSALETGMYIISINTPNGVISTPIIKQ